MANIFKGTRDFMRQLVPAPLRRSLPSAYKDDPAYQSYVQFLGLGQPIYTPRDFQILSKEGYERNPTVFRAITLIAQSCAGIPWKLYKKGNTLKTIATHPLLDLLDKPNQRNSGPEFLEHMISFWILSGNSYISAVMPDPRQPPTELWCLRPDRMRVIPGQGTIWGYEYNVDGYKTFFDADTTLHLKMFAATNDWYGLSPVAVAGALIDQQNEGFDWNTAILQNAGRPSGALVASGVLVNDQYERLKKILREKYTGKRNAGMPMLLEGGLDWKPFSLSPLELDWIESRKINMRDIAVALGVPSELLGDGDIKTYSNYQEARKSFYQETILPMMDRLAAKLNTWLVPMFDETLVLAYDKEEIEALQEDRDALSSRVINQYEQGIITLNEVRNALGLEQLDGGDILMINLVGHVYIPSDQLAEYVTKKLEDLMTPAPAQPPSAAPATQLPDTNAPQNDTGGESVNVGNESSDTGQNTPTTPPTQPALAPQPAAQTTPPAAPAQGGTSRQVMERKSAPRDAAYDLAKKTLHEYVKREKHVVVTAMQKAAFPQTTYDRAEAVIRSYRQQELLPLLLRTYRTIGASAYQLTREQLLGGQKLAGPDSFWSPDVRTRIAERVKLVLAAVTKKTLALLSEVLAIGVKRGESVSDLCDRAEQLYDEELTDSLDTPVESEAHFSFNLGVYFGALSTDVPLQKTWTTQGDERVRLAHRDADGQTVALEDPYSVDSQELMFPGDTSLGASDSNVINCRCYEEYTPLDDGKSSMPLVASEEALVAPAGAAMYDFIRGEKKRAQYVRIDTHDRKFNSNHGADGRFAEGDSGSGGGGGNRFVHASQTNFMKTKAFAQVVSGEIGVNARTVTGKGDEYMYELAHEIGFAGKPEVLSQKELDAKVKSGEIELFRGVTSQEYADAFREGDYFAGRGINGDGTYTETGKGAAKVASSYAGEDGEVLRMTLRSDARIANYEDVLSEYRNDRNALKEGLFSETNKEERLRLTAYALIKNDIGRWAMGKGYDAIKLPYANIYIILNRTSVRVQERKP